MLFCNVAKQRFRFAHWVSRECPRCCYTRGLGTGEAEASHVFPMGHARAWQSIRSIDHAGRVRDAPHAD